ncbi:pyridoxal 5'-phosphate synthase glutaminase subunit PdxT [Megasphaera vaginalis (ex Bordigoni et al. 2020)]|uniref:pyridoxal 5'-phosphate synthase glutaminase subunit PdxT n=1 Tax=Megasphaera vaginalis (ex Bordigoni et al. 2020) TaxID=2045301 RepID=UPI000C7DDFBD|nr:pyridoxal 5'-phosphate synthase glutaminase subunit PdxT [Megasphaera vaginalis (ex Bordigoni et al. 2020)]
MRVGVLAVQGAFAEHVRMVKKLGATAVELRRPDDLSDKPDGLILPGGESTVQGKLLRDLGMFATLQQWIRDDLPVLATCAGMILLARTLSNDRQRYFCTLPVQVRRNAYGRQLGSFIATAPFQGIGNVRMTFIRAPYIEKADPAVKILATVNERIVAVRYRNQIALSFHPEVGEDTRIHALFLQSLSTGKEQGTVFSFSEKNVPRKHNRSNETVFS